MSDSDAKPTPNLDETETSQQPISEASTLVGDSTLQQTSSPPAEAETAQTSEAPEATETTNPEEVDETSEKAEEVPEIAAPSEESPEETFPPSEPGQLDAKLTVENIAKLKRLEIRDCQLGRFKLCRMEGFR